MGMFCSSLLVGTLFLLSCSPSHFLHLSVFLSLTHTLCRSTSFSLCLSLWNFTWITSIGFILPIFGTKSVLSVRSTSLLLLSPSFSFLNQTYISSDVSFRVFSLFFAGVMCTFFGSVQHFTCQHAFEPRISFFSFYFFGFLQVIHRDWRLIL